LATRVTKIDAALVQQLAPAQSMTSLINGRAPGVALIAGSGAVGSGPASATSYYTRSSSNHFLVESVDRPLLLNPVYNPFLPPSLRDDVAEVARTHPPY